MLLSPLMMLLRNYCSESRYCFVCRLNRCILFIPFSHIFGKMVRFDKDTFISESL